MAWHGTVWHGQRGAGMVVPKVHKDNHKWETWKIYLFHGWLSLIISSVCVPLALALAKRFITVDHQRLLVLDVAST